MQRTNVLINVPFSKIIPMSAYQIEKNISTLKKIEVNITIKKYVNIPSKNNNHSVSVNVTPKNYSRNFLKIMFQQKKMSTYTKKFC